MQVFGNIALMPLILGDIHMIMAGEAYIEGDSLVDCLGPCQNPQDLTDVIRSINLIGAAADMFER